MEDNTFKVSSSNYREFEGIPKLKSDQNWITWRTEFCDVLESQNRAYMRLIRSEYKAPKEFKPVRIDPDTVERKAIYLMMPASEAKDFEKYKEHLIQRPMRMAADNTGAIALAVNPEFHARTKHMATRFHKIREVVDAGEVELVHISTSEMAADGLTKPLSKPKFQNWLRLMKMVRFNGSN